MPFSILIVDDEQIERDGIKFLLDKYDFDLKVEEAENGEEALEYLKSNPVDILFTDIKMPFMDGLELSKEAREIYPGIKIIIFSAYNEFDYAKAAINISVFHYILKPVEIEEFFNVITNVVNLCSNEEIEEAHNQKILGVYKKGIEYEKEKLLIDLINGIIPDDQFEKRADLTEINFKNMYIQMVMFDFKSTFYDTNNKDFKSLLNGMISYKYEYLNLNERQSVLFILNQQAPIEKYALCQLGEDLKNIIMKHYAVCVSIVFGNIVERIQDISYEFGRIESKLDDKFFFDESIVMFANGNYNELILMETVENLMANLYKCLDSDDLCSLEKGTLILFEKLNGMEQYSSIYVKYFCTEIIRRIFEKLDKNHQINFKYHVEETFKSDTLAQLKSAVQAAISALKAYIGTNDNDNKKVIKDIISIVEENYMNDISLEWLAEKVYLSPGYISYLFKKEIGQSLVKYITAYRLEKARDLLQNTNMKIVDICDNVGYNNISYFCSIFRNYFGVSPAKFREKDD